MLAERRRRTLVIDTNLLLLLLVGLVARDQIEKFKRTRHYTASDYDLLARLVSAHSEILVTPNVLTEVDNLITHAPGKLEFRCRQALASLLSKWREEYRSSEQLAASGPFLRLGLADASIQDLAKHADTVLTDDLPLYVAVSKSGHQGVINFTHVRAAAWSAE